MDQGLKRTIVLLAWVTIAAGTFFRFYHLDRKVFWGDEIASTIRILG